MIDLQEFITYPKISSLYKRDNSGVFTRDFSSPYFEYLYGNQWIGTEKIDGTNLRIIYDGELKKVELHGRTNNAQIPEFLQKDVFAYLNIEAFQEQFEHGSKVILFGEGYGSKIQKGGGRYLSTGTDFILFDVWVNGWWLQRDSVEHIAARLGMKVVPVTFFGNLAEAERFVINGFQSSISEDRDLAAEGLVLRPRVGLFNRRGHRIETKLKTKDYTV